MNLNFGLSGRNYVVTGANSGIGRAVAIALGKQGGKAVPILADLSREEEIARLISSAEDAIGPLSGLVNNAAACELPDTVLDADFGRYRRHYDVNLAAPTLLMRDFARRMSLRTQPSGHIVNISTDAARAFPGQVFYGTSKAALEAMTRAAAIELGPSSITVNVVAPGPVQTGYIDDALAAKVIPAIPLRRLGTPEDIAGTVLFFLSDASAWVTGQIV